MRVAVALGSGGARGYAHIGALEVLAERGHQVVAIAGTSMGALVGGVAAAGKLEPYTQWARSLTSVEVLRLLDPSISSGGALRLERVIAKVAEILDGTRIEDCPIPFTAVATDLNARREVWFQEGPIETAIRASIAIPSVITPIVVDGRLLVDGGLMNPVPIEPTRSTMADLTVAITLSGTRIGGVDQDAAASPVRTWRALTNRWSAMRMAERNVPVSVSYTAAPKDLSTVEIFNRSFDTMASLITRYRMAANPPDVLVSVPSDACRTTDFHRAAEMIALGRRLTTQALDEAGY